MTESPPQKGGKWSARMGTALRRSSTLLAIARPTTPSGSDKDSDTRSLRRSTSGTSIGAGSAPAPAAVSSPSPIAESPAREAAAMQEILGPSPLAQSTTTEPTGAQSTVAAEEQTSPIGYVPPPVIDSTVGNPGAFTDDPDILPQPQTVADPYALPPAEEEPGQEPIFAPVMAESMKSVESLSMPAAATAPVVAEPTTQVQTNPEPEFNTAVMPNFALPNYNVWAGSSQEVDKRSIAMPVAVAASQASSIKKPEPQHVGQFNDPFANPSNPVLHQ